MRVGATTNRIAGVVGLSLSMAASLGGCSDLEGFGGQIAQKSFDDGATVTLRRRDDVSMEGPTVLMLEIEHVADGVRRTWKFRPIGHSAAAYSLELDAHHARAAVRNNQSGIVEFTVDFVTGESWDDPHDQPF